MSRAVPRRDFLKACASLAALAALPSCSDALDSLRGSDPLPGAVALDASATIDPAFHLLSRAAYGARPGDVERVRKMGRDAWLDEQLAPASIDDSACDRRVASCEEYDSAPQELMSVRAEFVERDLQRVTLMRAVHSHRRLFEVMTGFWSDHFSIQTSKKGCRESKPLDDRAVVRAHALGRFRDMVRASALSPAMLHYLDGARNAVRAPGEKPNENYARELMELHTLGVRGGYSQKDVMEAARCLTGWTVEKGKPLQRLRAVTRDFVKGEKHEPTDVVFHREAHDDGEKTVLGTPIPAGGGERDLDALLDIVCRHPSTARHIARKLVRRFVADPPPEALVASTAEVFYRTEGSIADVVRHVLTSAEFDASAGRLVKRPFEFVVSALRATGAECRAGEPERRFLERMGHVPFHYPTPDGYPAEAEPWMGTLLWRWNFALALASGRLDPTKADVAALAKRCGRNLEKDPPADLAPLFWGRAATSDERASIDGYATGDRKRAAESVALLLCAPAFQVC